MHVRVALLALLAGLGLGPACGLDDDSSLERQLERAREASAKYQDVAVAEADGFVSTEVCLFDLVLGTMGIHYVHPGRVADPALAIEEPEALLYLRQHGELRLIAIEAVWTIVIDGEPYLGCGAEDGSCAPDDPPPAPPLYRDVTFTGPMPGHFPGMPWHYDLHVWLWADNPAGMFAQYNPTLSCYLGASSPVSDP